MARDIADPLYTVNGTLRRDMRPDVDGTLTVHWRHDGPYIYIRDSNGEWLGIVMGVAGFSRLAEIVRQLASAGE